MTYAKFGINMDQLRVEARCAEWSEVDALLSDGIHPIATLVDGDDNHAIICSKVVKEKIIFKE